MNKPIHIVTCTKSNDIKTSEIWQYLNKYSTKNFNTTRDFNHTIYRDNTDGLSKRYNEVLEKKEVKNSILVFAHDDLFIADGFLGEKLNAAMERFDIVGLAGIKAPIEIKSPAAWHMAGPPEQFSGAVAHYKPNDPISQWMTSFGPTPERVILIDGVFIAVNTEKISAAGLRFDEDFKFHHYDLSFCLRANALKLKIGTWPIYAVHRGLGTSMLTPEWKESEKKFKEKYT